MFSPPYQPQSNGLAERGVQTLKKMLLRSVVSGSSGSNLTVQDRLQKCLFNYRFAPTTTTKCSPAELMFKFVPRTELSMLKPPLNKVKSSDTNRKVKMFSVNDKVLANVTVKGRKKWFPARVMSKIGKVVYLIKLSDGFVRKVHVCQLKISFLDDKLHPQPRVLDVPVLNKSNNEENVLVYRPTEELSSQVDDKSGLSPVKSPMGQPTFSFT